MYHLVNTVKLNS